MFLFMFSCFSLQFTVLQGVSSAKKLACEDLRKLNKTLQISNWLAELLRELITRKFQKKVRNSSLEFLECHQFREFLYHF